MGLRVGDARPRATRRSSRRCAPALELGTNFTRPSPLELECAEAFLDLVVDGAEMVKFTKDGSTATTAALKLARAYTGRDLVAICAEHPFFSYDDWFIAHDHDGRGHPGRARRAGSRRVPLQRPRRRVARAFDASTRAGSPRSMLEPARTDEPRARLPASGCSELCTRNGAVLVFDEMITGFRWHIGGRRSCYGVVARPRRRSARRSPTASRSRRCAAGARSWSSAGRERARGRASSCCRRRTARRRRRWPRRWRPWRSTASEPVRATHAAPQGERLRAGRRARPRAARASSSTFARLGRPCNLLYATRGRRRRSRRRRSARCSCRRRSRRGVHRAVVRRQLLARRRRRRPHDRGRRRRARGLRARPRGRRRQAPRRPAVAHGLRPQALDRTRCPARSPTSADGTAAARESQANVTAPAARAPPAGRRRARMVAERQARPLGDATSERARRRTG